MRPIFFSIIFTLLCGFALAQENNSNNSKDKAFLFDQTSPEQAIKILGKPQSDKTEKLDILYINDWVGKDYKKEDCRVLFFKQFEDLGKVKLTFFEEKLIAIHFIVEKDIHAAQLSSIYKTQFIPIFNKFAMKSNVNEFEKVTKDVLVVDFPRNYYLIGTSKSSVLTARIFNSYAVDGNVRREPKWSPQNKMKTNPITGKVTDIQILSRKILK